ncbi:PEST proteolytic signal-containing nuclear protein-like [Gigantopelta aegis]|uniref:PEST proteolytic signal-containing nuclear protein-like n=1 Tax=Gigantopelta aegis TaxID=1735272 RepID=UPI001B88B52C|nr:PEST proteolytic signal-containing nuclear protein-like [Gigantopelta aegis]
MAEQAVAGTEQNDDDESHRSPKKRKHPESTPANDAAIPEKKKFSMAVNTTKEPDSKLPKKPIAPVKLALASQKKDAPLPVVKKSSVVAAVFNDDEDSEEEEMPAAAKMRMKNIGRDTPTAAGPNSFGKGKLGFSDRQSLYVKELKKAMDDVGADS